MCISFFSPDMFFLNKPILPPQNRAPSPPPHISIYTMPSNYLASQNSVIFGPIYWRICGVIGSKYTALASLIVKAVIVPHNQSEENTFGSLIRIPPNPSFREVKLCIFCHFDYIIRETVR